MIKIENTAVHGWEAAIRGMRNPMNSWDKSDSCNNDNDFCVGNNDLNLMLRLNRHPEESKYRRMIIVTVDITAPLYWWKEFDTYKVGTVSNSCSTMHSIHKKQFKFSDFSCENLDDGGTDLLESIIYFLNQNREKFLETQNKKYWWQMIQLLPSSYNQRRTIQLNYEVLAQIYRQRKNHKLDEWREFCKWIENLPYNVIIIGDEREKGASKCTRLESNN